MQKKYFHCYFCHFRNSHYVLNEQEGKNCRNCLAYNYFYNEKKKGNNINSTKRYNNNGRIKDSSDDEKKSKMIKYSWLKKEKLTEMENEKKDNYECSICLRIIKKNDDINQLKCGHVFHYKCIESLVDHQLYKCPNCRCNFKTEEKKKINQNMLNEFMNQFISTPIFGHNDDDSDNDFFI